MAQCFEQSHQAYSNGNGALAKGLSNKGKAHQKEMERMHAQASEWIFIGKENPTSASDTPLVVWIGLNFSGACSCRE